MVEVQPSGWLAELHKTHNQIVYSNLQMIKLI